MSTLSTHVLDTTLGQPAQGVPVHLARLTPSRPGDPGQPAPPQPELLRPPEAAPLPSADTTADSSAVGSGTTDGDGRISEFTEEQLEPGTYRLRFDTAAYAAATNQESFFPEVVVTFLITDERHYHVPLLLSPFAFSTYRGS
ncbi:MAG: 5-hydroxyisourate hydrolase [Kribbellaceae bacterium]|jgi:5-hydroxyisourate hydrolase|nr:5-hydroxyisourate hydrolase [Kribbellaceae bacterium]